MITSDTASAQTSTTIITVRTTAAAFILLCFATCLILSPPERRADNSAETLFAVFSDIILSFIFKLRKDKM